MIGRVSYLEADQGIPIGSANSLGGADLRCRCFSVIMCAKTKELGHVQGGEGARGLWTPPGSVNELFVLNKLTGLSY